MGTTLTDNSVPKRLYWWQFSLRRFLVVCLVAGVVAGYWMRPNPRHFQTLESMRMPAGFEVVRGENLRGKFENFGGAAFVQGTRYPTTGPCCSVTVDGKTYGFPGSSLDPKYEYRVQLVRLYETKEFAWIVLRK